MYPVRGHVLRVRAPWVRHYVNGASGTDSDCYIIPNMGEPPRGSRAARDSRRALFPCSRQPAAGPKTLLGRCGCRRWPTRAPRSSGAASAKQPCCSAAPRP
jgi:hypothetical protein